MKSGGEHEIQVVNVADRHQTQQWRSHMVACTALIWTGWILVCSGSIVALLRANGDYWADPRTRIRLVILGPMSLLFTVATLGGLICGHWMLAAIFGVEDFTLCAIGAGLHPLMTWRDLLLGFRSVNARAEALSLTAQMKYSLVDRACTQLGFLILIDAVALALRAGWKWYAAAGIGYIISGMSGGLLKFVFGSTASNLPQRLAK
jgi:hypothetical protein